MKIQINRAVLLAIHAYAVKTEEIFALEMAAVGKPELASSDTETNFDTFVKKAAFENKAFKVKVEPDNIVSTMTIEIQPDLIVDVLKMSEKLMLPLIHIGVAVAKYQNMADALAKPIVQKWFEKTPDKPEEI